MLKIKKTDPYEPRKSKSLYREVAKHIILPKNLPYFVYGLGIARNGTTVSLNFMAQAGLKDSRDKKYQVQCGYQHFKAGYRQAMHNWPKNEQNNEWQFTIPDASEFPIFYTKDPLGPYTLTEATFNPLLLLDLIKYNTNKLFIIFFFRDPEEVLISWKRNWGHVRNENVLRKNLQASSRHLIKLHKEVVKRNYPHAFYLYESLREHSPQIVVNTLFDQINKHLYPQTGLSLYINKHTVKNWSSKKIQDIWHPDEPLIYNRKEISKLHQSAKSTHSLKYKKYSEEEKKKYLSKEDVLFLKKSNLYRDYEYFRNLYTKSTGLKINRLAAS